MKFRKKPVVIEAVQWDGTKESLEKIRKLGERNIRLNMTTELVIETLEGRMLASLNDWVIRGVAGEVYPCKPDIFEKTYEPVTE